MTIQSNDTSEKLAAIAKKKLHKYQKKISNYNNNNNNDTLLAIVEQENIRLKEKLFKLEEYIEILEHKLQMENKSKQELREFIEHDVLGIKDDSLVMFNKQALDDYEKEKVLISCIERYLQKSSLNYMI
ncbi:uncharacterized protein BX663DRAFT_502594 [Cokeromyces recurvatus]|uniref:uncharacterized protein n=1 Tax=Cokeromyces recurvatus TaxID=90255 RepID=UPI00221EE7EB|nr:uncharacterized protein BX663DRAFT_502594 [Cokeromyces recurvatus]KAI7904495.1 hypothetical protein BX663DRAFT_502594 [Cokeromyces recurvatus]